MPAPVDYDAIAAKYGGTDVPAAGAAPPDYDAIAAKYGGTDVQQPMDEDARWRAKIAKNDEGGGLYSMKGPDDTPFDVPHNWVVDAATRGYDFANDEDRARYKKNARPGGWDLPDIPVVGGFVDNVSRRLSANLQNMSEVVAGPHPLDTLVHGTQEGEEMFGNPNAPVANMAGDILSLLAQDKAIQTLATPSLRLKAASAAFETVEKLPPSLQRVVAAGLEESRLGRATQAAVTGAPKLAAQDLLTGRGAKQAAISGAIGAAVPYAMEGTGAVISKASQGTKNVLGKFADKTVDIGSETGIKVEPQQVGEEGEILPGGTQKPKNARDQQAAFDRDMQNSSKRALRVSLQKLNDAISPERRPLLAAPAPGAEMPTYTLTGPTGGEVGTEKPFLFDLQGPPTTENAPAQGYREYNGQTGEIGEPVNEAQAGFLHPAQPLERTGAPASYGSPEVPEPQPSAWERTPQGERPIAATMHPGPEGPSGPATWEQVLSGEGPENVTGPVRRDVVGGGGVSGQTDNPAEAISKRNQYRRIMDSPEFKDLPAAQQEAIRGYHDHLTDQLGMYYAQPHGGITPANIASATDHVVSPGDAANQIEMQLKPGFDELDRLTDGRINELSREIQDARGTLRSSKASTADKQEAWRTINANKEEIDNQIKRHAGDTSITRQYYTAMRQSYADHSFLNGVNDVIEGWANGISRANTANSTNLKRVIRADPADFENFLKQGNNRETLNRLMGPQAEETIKSWGQLLSNPATARQTGKVLEDTTRELFKLHRLAWAAGFFISPKIAGAAAVTTWGSRQLMRVAANSPNVTRLIDYAVRNNVDSRIYAPLIARAVASLSGPQGEQPQEQGEQPQEQPQQ